MKKSFIASALLIAVNFCSFDTSAQCSDAGVCQIGGHLAEGEDMEKLNLSASYKYGYSGKEDDIQYHSFVLTGNYNVLDNSSVQFMLPYNSQSGPAGTVNGIGDLIVSLNQNLLSDENSSFNASVGVKLAAGDENKDNLPQTYQSGLGTNDILIGLSYYYGDFGFGAGYQHSGGRNDNLYRLDKGDDILVRTSYELQLEPLSITPQLLYIQPLAKSSILDLTSTAEGNFIEVDKSNKPQLNLLTELRYELAGNLSLKGDFAIPFIKREVNVDGLTRAFSASFGLSYSIN
jgi:hypothetical protein